MARGCRPGSYVCRTGRTALRDRWRRLRCATTRLVIIAGAESTHGGEGCAAGIFGPAPSSMQRPTAAPKLAPLSYGDWQQTWPKQSAKYAGRLPAAGHEPTFTNCCNRALHSSLVRTSRNGFKGVCPSATQVFRTVPPVASEFPCSHVTIGIFFHLRALAP